MGFSAFRLFVVTLLTAFFAAGCTIGDEDRCANGLQWSKEQAGCIVLEDTSEPQDTDTTPVQDGLGNECMDDPECADAGVYDYCLHSPLDPEGPGICTIPDCTWEDCGGSYQCCDCTDASFPTWPVPYCVDPSSASLLDGVCPCE